MTSGSPCSQLWQGQPNERALEACQSVQRRLSSGQSTNLGLGNSQPEPLLRLRLLMWPWASHLSSWSYLEAYLAPVSRIWGFVWKRTKAQLPLCKIRTVAPSCFTGAGYSKDACDYNSHGNGDWFCTYSFPPLPAALGSPRLQLRVWWTFALFRNDTMKTISTPLGKPV